MSFSMSSRNLGERDEWMGSLWNRSKRLYNRRRVTESQDSLKILVRRSSMGPNKISCHLFVANQLNELPVGNHLRFWSRHQWPQIYLAQRGIQKWTRSKANNWTEAHSNIGMLLDPKLISECIQRQRMLGTSKRAIRCSARKETTKSSFSVQRWFKIILRFFAVSSWEGLTSWSKETRQPENWVSKWKVSSCCKILTTMGIIWSTWDSYEYYKFKRTRNRLSLLNLLGPKWTGKSSQSVVEETTEAEQWGRYQWSWSYRWGKNPFCWLLDLGVCSSAEMGQKKKTEFFGTSRKSAEIASFGQTDKVSSNNCKGAGSAGSDRGCSRRMVNASRIGTTGRIEVSSARPPRCCFSQEVSSLIISVTSGRFVRIVWKVWD